MGGQRVAPGELDELIRLYNDKLTCAEIARRTGRSESFVYRALRELRDEPAAPAVRPSGRGAKRWTPDDLVQAVRTTTHISDCITALGLSARAPANRTRILAEIQLAHLDTSHWVRRTYGDRGARRELVDVMVANSDYPTSRLGRRLVSEGVRPHQCESCGLREWCEVPIPLELDHINGVPNDHRPENVRLLCPNCHALTPTWRGRNRKK